VPGDLGAAIGREDGIVHVDQHGAGQVGHRFTAISLPALSIADHRGRSAANIRFSAWGPIPVNDVDGLWMPGDAEIRSSLLAGALFLFLFVFVFVVIVFVFFVVFLFVVRIVLGEFKHGQWQRLAKEIAFIAHPHARDFAVVDFHDAQWMAAGFQNDDVAWLQIHDYSSDCTTRIAP
jgi:hypothetical protein